MFQRLVDHGLVIKPGKCVFAQTSLDFLGHRVDAQGIHTLSDKMEAIQQFPQPQTNRKLREFIGLVSYYRRFVPHCADFLQPLHALVCHNKPTNHPITWTPDSVTAFNKVKTQLAAAILLVHPVPDAPLNLIVDASDFGAGGALQQFVIWPTSVNSRLTFASYPVPITMWLCIVPSGHYSRHIHGFESRHPC